MKRGCSPLPKNQYGSAGKLSQGGAGHQRATAEVSGLCHHACVTVVAPFSIFPSDPVCITGTRHRLHNNASPPLRCCGAKQRRPASSNTATESAERGPRRLFMTDRYAEWHANHVNALHGRNKAGCFLSLCPTLFAGNNVGLFKTRRVASLSKAQHHNSIFFVRFWRRQICKVDILHA